MGHLKIVYAITMQLPVGVTTQSLFHVREVPFLLFQTIFSSCKFIITLEFLDRVRIVYHKDFDFSTSWTHCMYPLKSPDNTKVTFVEIFSLSVHYENTPIQIHWKFYH